MRCRFPLLVRNKQGYLVHAPCGQCTACRINQSRQWSSRITHEQLKYGDKSSFLTLTYDDEHLPADCSVHKRELSLFIKRFRKALGTKKLRFFGCGEYGDKFGRPHYHVIIFGVPVDSDVYGTRHVHYEKGRPLGWHCDFKCWPFGKTHIGTVTSDSANYCAGYVFKKIKGKKGQEYYSSLGIEPEFVLMSRRPGIGQDYVVSHSDYYRVHPYVTIKGVKYPLPRYYVDKAGVRYNKLEALKVSKAEDKALRDFCDEQGIDFIRYVEDLADRSEKELVTYRSLKHASKD